MMKKLTGSGESDDITMVRVVSDNNDNGDNRESQWWECSNALVKGRSGRVSLR